jgi:hypothetical protein
MLVLGRLKAIRVLLSLGLVLLVLLYASLGFLLLHLRLGFGLMSAEIKADVRNIETRGLLLIL